MTAPSEYVCVCRSCGNHCMVSEPDRRTPVGGMVLHSDGFLGGWPGVQTEVVTCPHCGIVMSWRKSCQSAELLRQAGDLGRFQLPRARWGPPPLYWAGFKQYDEMFHPQERPAPGQALPRLRQAPEPTQLWALRKRAWVALGLLWLDNDREREGHYFGGNRPGPRTAQDEVRRARWLRALLEAALFDADTNDATALQVAEWHRELGEWDDAMDALDRTFEDFELADRARQLAERIDAQSSRVFPFERAQPQVTPVLPPSMAQPRFEVSAPAPFADTSGGDVAARDSMLAPLDGLPDAPPTFEPTVDSFSETINSFAETIKPEPEPEIMFEPLAPPAAKGQAGAPAAAPEPEAPASSPVPAAPASSPLPAGPVSSPIPVASAPGTGEVASPRGLLTTLVEVLGSLPADTLTRKVIPRPYGALIGGLAGSYKWDRDSLAVAVMRGFARAHGWPDDADKEALEFMEGIEVPDQQLEYLANGFKRATWDKWAFDVPQVPPPKGKS